MVTQPTSGRARIQTPFIQLSKTPHHTAGLPGIHILSPPAYALWGPGTWGLTGYGKGEDVLA